MQRQIPIREVNQHLSRYIESVEKGEEIIITKRGKPVALLSSAPSFKEKTSEQIVALERMRIKMRKGYSLGGEPFDRDKVHER